MSNQKNNDSKMPYPSLIQTLLDELVQSGPELDNARLDFWKRQCLADPNKDEIAIHLLALARKFTKQHLYGTSYQFLEIVLAVAENSQNEHLLGKQSDQLRKIAQEAEKLKESSANQLTGIQPKTPRGVTLGKKTK